MKLNKIFKAFENQRHLNSEQVKQMKLSETDINLLIQTGLIDCCFNDDDYVLTPTSMFWQENLEQKKEFRQALIKNSFNLAMAVLSAICGSAATLLLQSLFIK